MAQPSVNDVLTWDGAKGVYAPPTSEPSLALTDTYIFVGNAIDVATGVPLSLNDEPGPFALANTGVLTMPDASVSGRGLLNAASWTTAGFLHNDGSGGLEWQVVSTSQTLAATLAIGNNVGGLAITATDGTASLNLTTGTVFLYANSGSAGAPRFTLDQSAGLARLSSTYGVVDFDATAMNLTHGDLINFSALEYTITNITPDSYLYVDAGGFIVAGAAPITATPTLNDVLTAGNSSNTIIRSVNTKSSLVFDGSATFLDWTSGSINGNVGANDTAGFLSWTDGTASGGVALEAAKSELSYSDGLGATGLTTIGASALNLIHSSLIKLDAPAVRFEQLTASKVPYLDASKNLVSSAITPTELGYLTGSTSPLQAQIDAIVSGLSWKQAVRVRTTANITLSGTQTIDGIAVIANDRVLVMNQTAATENGIYVCSAGAWSRSTDADTGAELLQATVATQEGTLYADQQYVCTTDAPITIGVSNIVFILVGGTTYVGTTNRITVTGNVIDIAATYVGQTSITTLGTITTGTLGSGSKILVGSDATYDMYYNGGAGAITRLATANTSVLTTNGSGVPSWSAQGTAFNKNTGSVAGTVAAGDDPRFGNEASIGASAIDWDVTSSYKTLSANTTFTFSNAANAKTIMVAITNTASNYTVTWPTVRWTGGVAPIQTIGAKTDVYTFTQINGIIYGAVIQNLS